jgi:isopenicillin N synthase-like dioxygenase
LERLKNLVFLEIFSNGKYKSVEHRVVPNRDKGQFSIGSFAAPSFTTHVKPPPELTAKQGQLYNGCRYADYVVRFLKSSSFPNIRTQNHRSPQNHPTSPELKFMDINSILSMNFSGHKL